eukprot:TRINITY_DN433_c0_g1_i1.p1 TRINITY_DN433_c0_g1~~TRINITY_DN433_c0_g1_i1.p1  ORF type:complete len:152 (-),score=40.71 TRINITY_DN433_c0_g1_i1:90-545(-)
MGNRIVMNDITNDTNNVIEYATQQLDYDPDNVEKQAKRYPDSHHLQGPATYPNYSIDEVYDAYITVINEEDKKKWTLVHIDEDEYFIEFTETTSWIKFVDDVIVRITTDDDGTVIARVRSKSRSGKDDFHQNKKRIEYLLDRVVDVLEAST